MRDLSTEEVGRGRKHGHSSARLAAAVLAITACLFAAPSLAAAGDWMEVSCVNPNQSAAPSQGWTSFTTGGGYGSGAGTGCSPGAPMYGILSTDAGVGVGSGEDLQYTPPSGSTLVGGSFDATVSTDGYGADASGVVAAYSPAFEYNGNVFFQCAHGEELCPNGTYDYSGVISLPANRGGALYVGASCGGDSGQACDEGGNDGAWSLVDVWWANLLLSNSATPAASGVSGTLLSPNASGTAELTFTASDPGGPGVYAVTVQIDGKTLYSGTPNNNGGECVPVGSSGGALMFDYSQPCRESESVDLPINTTALANGQHTLKVTVEDAAQNSAVVYDETISIANPNALTSTPIGSASPVSPIDPIAPIGPGSSAVERGPANGVNASDEATLSARWARTNKAAFTSRYGVRERITGNLTTTAGQPISGALLDVYATPGYEGAQARISDAGLRTEANGQWTLTLPADVSSCALRFAYRSHANDTVAAASATLDLNVHAGLALHITPHTASVGRKIYFNGVLHGIPIPPDGKELVLEASSGGEWVQFDTIHTDAKGRFHASYRFKYPGPITYRFRIFSAHEADFPYLDGTSNGVIVHEH
jgi:hypothetical protein